MKLRISLLFSFILASLLVSCNPIQTSIAPILTPSGEAFVAKPKAYKLDERTRKSDEIRLMEDITTPMDHKWLGRTLKLDRTKGEVAGLNFVMARAQFTEKSSRKKFDAYIPLFSLEYLNVPQERVDQAMPAIQREYYRQIRKRCSIVPLSRLEKAENQRAL